MTIKSILTLPLYASLLLWAFSVNAINTDSTKIVELIQQGKSLLDTRNDSSYIFFNKALFASKKSAYKTLIKESLFQIGRYHKSLANIDSALYYFNQVDMHCHSYSATCAQANAIKAEIENERANTTAAIDEYFKLLNKSSKAQDTGYVLYSSYKIASLYYYLGRDKESKKISLTYLAYCNSSKYGLAYTQYFNNTLGNIYNNSKPDSAIYFFNLSKQAAIDADDSMGLMTTENNIANYYIKTKKYQFASDILKKCLKFSNYHNLSRSKAAALINLGFCYYNLDSANHSELYYELSKNYLINGIAESKRGNYIEYLAKGYDNLSKLYYEHKFKDEYYNSKDSFYFFSEKITELNNKQNISKLEYYKTLIENETQKRELIAENAKNREKIFRRNMLLTIISFFTLMFFILFFNIKKKNKLIGKQAALLTESNAKLENTNYRKDQMLSVVSHDLKGPLNNIAYLQTEFINDDIDYETLKPLSKELTQSINIANNLLDSILTWAKLFIEGKVLKELFNLNTILYDVKNQLAFNLTKKNIILNIKARDIYNLNTDKNVLAIVLRNLLSNAIKFTPKGGTIEVYTSTNATHLFLHIKDSGSGFHPSVAAKFKSADKTQLDSLKGTNGEIGNGIGLMLSREFAAQINLGLEIESTNTNGTIMRISIPLSLVK